MKRITAMIAICGILTAMVLSGCGSSAIPEKNEAIAAPKVEEYSLSGKNLVILKDVLDGNSGQCNVDIDRILEVNNDDIYMPRTYRIHGEEIVTYRECTRCGATQDVPVDIQYYIDRY